MDINQIQIGNVYWHLSRSFNIQSILVKEKKLSDWTGKWFVSQGLEKRAWYDADDLFESENAAIAAGQKRLDDMRFAEISKRSKKLNAIDAIFARLNQRSQSVA